MFYPQAYEQAKRLGREIKQNVPGAMFADPDSFDTLTKAQAMADNWVVSDEKSYVVTPAILAKAWNDAIAAGGYRTVKPADSSPMFKGILEAVAQNVGTTARR